MIAQWYCNNPFLYEGKKFVIRTWAVIIASNPKMVRFTKSVLSNILGVAVLDRY
jgi:hypothetical protein